MGTRAQRGRGTGRKGSGEEPPGGGRGVEGTEGGEAGEEGGRGKGRKGRTLTKPKNTHSYSSALTPTTLLTSLTPQTIALRWSVRCELQTCKSGVCQQIYFPF